MSLGLSISATDWDHFLGETPLAQFQQTAGWGCAKGQDGWDAYRVWLSPEPRVIGAQLLTKATAMGRIGYVSKGPVARAETEEAHRSSLAKLCDVAAALRLKAIIVQPPDDSRISPRAFAERGFDQKAIRSIIHATAVIRLDVGDYRERMNRQVSREARQAIRGGATTRLGDRSDAALFHSLMLETCRRQGSSPNPANPKSIESFWESSTAKNYFAFVDYENETVAGLWMIGFGDRLTFWKKGWRDSVTKLPINSLLMVQALQWAVEWGYRRVDFVAMDSNIASNLILGRPLTEVQRRSRDMFNLRLGAEPQMLPMAYFRLSSPVLRKVYSFCPAGIRAYVERRMS